MISNKKTVWKFLTTRKKRPEKNSKVFGAFSYEALRGLMSFINGYERVALLKE